MKNVLQAFLFLLTLTATSTIEAQVAPSIEWQKCLGGSDFDVGMSIHQIQDSGFIVTGPSASNDGDVFGNHGVWDYCVFRLDNEGNIVWQQSFGGGYNEDGRFIRQTSDGGFIIAGASASNDGNVTGHHGSTGYFDYWIVKSDIDGNLVWEKSFGGSADDEARSIQQTTDGGFIVAGRSLSNNGDVNGHHNNYDFWIVKLDTAGNLMWQKSLGGNNNDQATSIQQTSDGGFIVSGNSDSNDGDVSGNHGGWDYWIVKLDSGGNIEWQKSLGGSDDEAAISMEKTTDGGFIVAGTSRSNDGDVSGNQGADDYWIVKLDAAGIIIWGKTFGGSELDEANSIQQTFDGGFIIAGLSDSFNGDVYGNHGAEDCWIIKLDTGGNLIWQKCLGGIDYDQAISIQQTSDSGFIFSGYTLSIDGDVSGNHGGYDFWIVKLSSDIATGIPHSANNFISLYPNPVQNQLTIALASPANETTIHVCDLQGRMMTVPTTFKNTQAQLTTTSLVDGFYTIQITNTKTGGIVAGKFVKQK
ncbi:MAG TPA: T9SS type A sorting domain-containing protein [Chitinophagales bacterium]|nr:T9SS type A sorting domain-containing protein [Chitinophagales bacterium]